MTTKMHKNGGNPVAEEETLSLIVMKTAEVSVEGAPVVEVVDVSDSEQGERQKSNTRGDSSETYRDMGRMPNKNRSEGKIVSSLTELEEDIEGTCSVQSLHSEQVSEPVPPNTSTPPQKGKKSKPKKRGSFVGFTKKRAGSMNSGVFKMKARKMSMNLVRRNTKPKSGKSSKVLPPGKAKQKTKSRDKRGMKARFTKKIMSTSSLPTTMKRSRVNRLGANKNDKLSKERKQKLELLLRNCLFKLKDSIMCQQQEVFVGCFDKNCVINDPVEVLKETDPLEYFHSFVEAYSVIQIVIDQNSIVCDVNEEEPKLFCQVEVVTQYSNTKSSTKFSQTQHWQLIGKAVESIVPVVLDLKDNEQTSQRLEVAGGNSTREIRKLQSKPRVGEGSQISAEGSESSDETLKIVKWNNFWSMSACKKLTGRTFKDSMSSLSNWTHWSRKYGTTYLKKQIYESFRLHVNIPQLKHFGDAVRLKDYDAFVALFSANLKLVDVSGSFDFFFSEKEESREGNETDQQNEGQQGGAGTSSVVSEVLMGLFTKFKKLKCKEVRVVETIICGDIVSARLVLSQGSKAPLVPAFLVLNLDSDLQVEKNDISKRRITKLVFCGRAFSFTGR